MKPKNNRVQRAADREVRRSHRRLSRADLERVARILSRPSMSFMDHPAFHQAGAARALFDDAPALPNPNCDWYHPGVDAEFDVRQQTPQANTLLNSAQEKAIFLQFNFARFRAAQVHAALSEAEAMDHAMAAELLHWHAEASRLRDRIVEFNLALVLAMARHVAAAKLDFSDLLSEGNMALLRAVDKFDVGRNFKFSTYACRAILKAFSRMSVTRSRRQSLLGGAFDPAIEQTGSDARFEQHEMSEYTIELRRAIDANEAALSDIEQQVIASRFPMEDDRSSDRPTLNEVGRQIGYSKERVRQIQQQALAKLRDYLESKFIDLPFDAIPD